MIVSVVTSWTCPCGTTGEGVSVYDATIRIRETRMRFVLGVRAKGCEDAVCRMHDVAEPDSHRLTDDDQTRVLAARQKLKDRNAQRYAERKSAAS